MEEANQRVLQELDRVAKARRLPHAQVALAWLLQKDGVTASIVGASKLSHLEDAIAAVQVELAPEDLKALEAPYVPHPVAASTEHGARLLQLLFAAIERTPSPPAVRGSRPHTAASRFERAKAKCRLEQ